MLLDLSRSHHAAVFTAPWGRAIFRLRGDIITAENISVPPCHAMYVDLDQGTLRIVQADITWCIFCRTGSFIPKAAL